MKTLSLEKMETIEGGGCSAAIGSAMVSIWGLAGAAAATGVGAGFGVALGLVGLGLSMYSAMQCQL